MVSVDEVGTLSLSDLGTKPPVSAVTSHVRELNYDKIEAEHRSLLQVIRDSQSDHKTGNDDTYHIRCFLFVCLFA